LNIDSAPPATAAPGDRELSPAETLEAPFEIVVGLVIVFGGQKIYCERNKNARKRNISETNETLRRMAEIPYVANKHVTHNKSLDSHQEKQEKNNLGKTLKVNNLQGKKEPQHKQERELSETYYLFDQLNVSNSRWHQLFADSSEERNSLEKKSLDELFLEGLKKNYKKISNSQLWNTIEDSPQTDKSRRFSSLSHYLSNSLNDTREKNILVSEKYNNQLPVNHIIKRSYSESDLNKRQEDKGINDLLIINKKPPENTTNIELQFNDLCKTMTKLIEAQQKKIKDDGEFMKELKAQQKKINELEIADKKFHKEDDASFFDYSNRDMYKEVDRQTYNPMFEARSKLDINKLWNQLAQIQKLNTLKSPPNICSTNDNQRKTCLHSFLPNPLQVVNDLKKSSDSQYNNNPNRLSEIRKRVDAFIKRNPIKEDLIDTKTNSESSQTDSTRSDSI
jgi:hypothetical protein